MGGWGGVISGAYKKFELRCINSYRYVFPEYVAELILDLRTADMDASLLVCGDNGSGKSVAAAIIWKCLNPDKPFNKEHVVYAEDKTSDFMTKMEALKDDCLIIDELNKFMSHRSFLDKSQNKLIQFIEIARAKRVATISCVNAYTKVDKSFREGKVGVVIQMFDRKAVDDGLGRSCGAVFASPPLMLSSSRFGLDALADVHSDQEFINLAPWLPAFRGFIFFPDKKEYLTDNEWNNYTEAKMRGIRKSFEQAKAQTLNQEKREMKGTVEETEDQVIEEKVGKKILNEKIKKITKERLKVDIPNAPEPEPVEHACGCITHRERGMVVFQKKCGFHRLRPDKTTDIQLNHRKLEKTEEEEETEEED